MNTQKEREDAVFEAANKLRPTQRGPYLDHACMGDEELRQRVEMRLNAQEANADSTTRPSGTVFDKTVALPFVPAPPGEKSGDRVGRYRLLEKIGEGGMGIVWLAEQTEPVRRKVALKVVKLGMDTREVVARFEVERQALAFLDHPNIAKLLDAGATDTGRPYFVMEYSGGTSITDYCDRHTLTLRLRLELFIQVCRTIEHAHRNGIIHRDIKPSNILVTLSGGSSVPTPRLIDFGIAKATGCQTSAEQLAQTVAGDFMGTPAYMSPEQAEMTGLGIDVRTDIYSLGVVLYELLTGQTPLEAARLAQAGRLGAPRIIREEEAPPPSTKLARLDAKTQTAIARQRQTLPPALIASVRGDLDWIVLKTLEKDRTRRYDTAEKLATDLQRHLDNKPIEARPPNRLYRLKKMLRRNKRTLTAASVAAFLTLVVSIAAVLAVREPVSHALAAPPPTVLSQNIKALPAGGVLDLIYTSAPPPPPPHTQAPSLQFEIQAKRKGAVGFSSLKDGDTLASQVDDYVMLTRALCSGYLYIFQVDSSGKTQWVFPVNDAVAFSSGTNPVTLGQVVQVPTAEMKGFYLDQSPGIEHVYAVFSPTRWPELELALSRPSPAPTSSSIIASVQEPNHLQSRGIEGTHVNENSGIASEPPLAERVYEGAIFRIPMRDQPLRASGTFLVIERWFRHVNSQ